MRTPSSFAHDVRVVENEWIPLRDGTRLAARIWLPADAEARPVPAILEYLPYRKRDFTRTRDEPMHHYFAGHGYASVRVDVRGSGDSEGLLDDEYVPVELTDACEVIEWLAARSWCSGRVGMFRISWGGFNALQVAAMAPPALDAIITLCASDDRYADDAHYMGGCLLNENQIWGNVLFTVAALPPDPEVVGDDWRETWRARLEHLRPFAAEWLRHPLRDEFWRHGSVCEDYASIRCPVYAIGGWADGYSNAVPRLLAGLRGPRKGLIGPWAHAFPHNGVPGPAIGFLQEAVRWWDHWLRGKPTGIMDEPMLRVWMQDGATPQPLHEERSGRWIAESEWPSARIEVRPLHLSAISTLDPEEGEEAALEICSPQTTGLVGGDWCGFGSEGEAPVDQRPDDGRSLVWDSKPLAAPMEILGAPVAHLELAVDQPLAFVAVRLNDVAPDGTSERVTFGLCNLTHADDHADAAPLESGRRFRVRVPLNDAAHSFAAGHSLRLAISTAYWPMAWPSPEPVRLTVFAGASRVELPVRPASEDDAKLPAFGPPEAAPTQSEQVSLKPPRFVRTVERDLRTGEVVYRLFSDGGDLETAAVARIEEIALDLGHTVERRFTIDETEPLTARAELRERVLLRRADWKIVVETATALSATTAGFVLTAEVRALEGDAPVFERRWEEAIARVFV